MEIITIHALLFVASGVLIGLAIALLFFKMATKKQLEKTKLQAMADMYQELLLKRKHKDYRYSKDAEAAVKAVSIANMLE